MLISTTDVLLISVAILPGPAFVWAELRTPTRGVPLAFLLLCIVSIAFTFGFDFRSYQGQLWSEGKLALALALTTVSFSLSVILTFIYWRNKRRPHGWGDYVTVVGIFQVGLLIFFFGWKALRAIF